MRRNFEQSLRRRLRFAGEAGELGDAGADECDRQLPLHGAVQAGDQCLDLAGAQELDLVDEEGDPGLALLGCFT